MKNKIFYIFLLIIFFSSCEDDTSKFQNFYNIRKAEYKSDTWDWHKCIFPESILTSLQRDTVFNSIFFDIPKVPVKMIDSTAWEYRLTFEINDDALNGRYELVFDGIVAMADIFLNDEKIAESSDMFLRQRINITDYVKKGRNIFTIKFKSFDDWQKFYQKYGTLPLKGREMMRIPYFFTSKEMGIAYIPIGFQGDFKIINWKKAIIRDVRYDLTLLKPNSIAKIKSTVTVEAEKNTDATITIYYKNKNLISKNIRLNKGLNTIPLNFSIEKPKLWWTYDMGEPFMYQFVTTIKINKKNVTKNITNFGIREIDIDTTGHNFVLRLNGLPVTLKILNYIRPELLKEKIKKTDYADYVRDFVLAGINTVHIDEKGLYENDEFYKQCDIQGVLVWQDFMLPYKYFPLGNDYENLIKQETEYQVKRLVKHPSIAFWSGQNFWSKYYTQYIKGTNIDSAKASLTNKKIFNQILPEILHKNDSSAFYFDKMDFKSIIFITDHFAEYPQVSTYRSFTKSNMKKISSKSNIFHSRPHNADSILQEQFNISYNFKPTDITQQIYLSNLFKREYYEQKLLNSRYGLYTGYICGNYRDFSPLISNSCVDYRGFWKGKMYAIKNTMSPLLIDITQSNGWIEIGVKSEKLEDINADFYFVLYDFNGKSFWRRNSLGIKVYKDSYMKYFNFNLSRELSIIGKRNAVFLVQVYADEELIAEKIYLFSEPTKLKLKPPTITKKIYRVDDGYVLELSTDFFAYGVCLFTEKKGILSDNYFSIIPGQPKKVKFYTKKEIYDIQTSFKTIDFTQRKQKKLYNIQKKNAK